MKTLLKSTIAIAFILFTSLHVFSQWAVCTPEPSVTDPEGVGVRYPYLLPVGFNNEPYHTVLTIISPRSAETWGNFDVTITRIQLTTITNIPEGLDWETNSGNEDDYMYGGEKYCLVLQGTPNSIPGIRTVEVYANAWIRLLFEFAAPGNPQMGGTVKYTLCHELNLELGNDTTITTNGLFNLNVNQGNDYHKYLWQDGSTNPSFTVRGSDLGVGVHKIKVTVSDTVGTTGIHTGSETRCFKSDSISVTVVNANSIDLTASGKLQIFPNPGDGKIAVNIPAEFIGSRLSVLDTKGSIVFDALLEDKESYFDLSGLCKGMYIVMLTGEELNTVTRLIIE